MIKKKKSRRRSDRQREHLRHRIILHTGDVKTVGTAQWQRHLKLGNLTRKSNDDSIQQRLDSDPRLALVKPGLIAYEREYDHALVFESRVSTRPVKGAQSNYWQCIKALLLMEPTLPRSEADRLMRNGLPRLQLQNTLDESGDFVLP